MLLDCQLTVHSYLTILVIPCRTWWNAHPLAVNRKALSDLACPNCGTALGLRKLSQKILLLRELTKFSQKN